MTASQSDLQHLSPGPVTWSVSPCLVGYPEAVRAMQERAAAIAAGTAPELIWLLEHPALYSSGTSARADEVLNANGLPVYPTGRGGRVTYHGPGQRIAYVMLDLKRRGGDVRAFVAALEGWLIDTLGDFGVEGAIRDGRVGVWVSRPDKGTGIEDKIAAIGLRVSKGVTLHGISLNVSPDLAHYNGIVPCGIVEHGVTSLADLGVGASIEAVDNALRRHFERRFGVTIDAIGPLEDAQHLAPRTAEEV